MSPSAAAPGPDIGLSGVCCGTPPGRCFSAQQDLVRAGGGAGITKLMQHPGIGSEGYVGLHGVLSGGTPEAATAGP